MISAHHNKQAIPFDRQVAANYAGPSLRVAVTLRRAWIVSSMPTF